MATPRNEGREQGRVERGRQKNPHRATDALAAGPGRPDALLNWFAATGGTTDRLER